MVQHYELMYILPGTKTDEEVQPIVAQVHGILQQHGANLTKTDFWGKRKLAYDIDHIRQGFYDLVEFDLEATKLNELDNVLRLDDQVLRHQIVRKELKTPEELAAEQALRDRIAAKRQEAKEKEQVADLVAGQSEPKPEPIATGPVKADELAEKLEEILESDSVDV